MQSRPDIYHLQVPDAEFVVCDVETTGFSPQKNRVTEIALVRVVNCAITERFSSLINPRQFIPREIESLTGITNAMVYGAPDAGEVIPEVRRFIGDAIFIGHNVQFDRGFVNAECLRAGCAPLESPALCTARLSRRLMPALGRKSLSSIARYLGIVIKGRHRAAGDAEATARIFMHFLTLLQEEFGIAQVADLLSFQNRPVYRITGAPRYFTRLKDTLANVPHEPGVYFFHDRRGHIIYVGKAKDLRDRVHSYFSSGSGHTEKVGKLVKSVHAITWETTDTELSALLLEARNIRLHQPRFNTMLKHERKYPFIRIDTSDPFPTLTWTYDLEEDEAEYFGPYGSRFAVEDALGVIQRLFLIRECDGRLKPSASQSPCMYYDIKRCAAPCALLQTEETYGQEVEAVRLFLLGQHDKVLDGLRSKMTTHSQSLEYEAAAEVRDRIAALQRLTRQQRVMVRSVHEQNLVLITPARRTFVEVHCIRGGMLVAQCLIDQKNPNTAELLYDIERTFFTLQEEMFVQRPRDVNEMRIVITWCLTRRDETTVIEVDQFENAKAVEKQVLEELMKMNTQSATERKAG